MTARIPDDFVCQPVDEVIALRLDAEVLERKHRNDGLFEGSDVRRADRIPAGDARQQSAWRPRRSHVLAEAFPPETDDEDERGRHADRMRQRHACRARFERRQIRGQCIGALVATLRPRIDRALDDPGELR